ncbi:hypothetical protein [Pararhodobacter oceanensis]|uniref:hypothetical protein n=1 Tax=Pararhodobacter oceanensis TaxID=2172121 RepID=UPI00140201DE|nr:hypothetical protein [Pararhodobacter oceanensis]
MKRLFLGLGLLVTAACTPTQPPMVLPTHPDPLCFYTEPAAPGEPLGEVCA